MKLRERLLMIVAFAAIHIVWGTTYLAIRYAVATIPPLLTAGLRHILGGGALYAYCHWRGMRATATQWRAAAVTGVLFFLIGHGSLHWAELYVPSGTAALFVATEPVWIALLGIAGVAILVGTPHQSFASLVIVAGALSWSIGIFQSRGPATHPVPLMAAAMSLLCGGVQLLIAATLTGGASVQHVSLASAAGLGYLVVFGSLTFAGYTWLLTRCSPVLIATHTYTNPLIAVLLGAAIAGEALTPRVAIAAAAILIAIALVRHAERAQ